MESFIREGLKILDPELELEQEPSMPAAHLATMFDVQGPNINCLTACAASSQAVGEATELIRRGQVDAMIAGGAHSMIHPFGLTGFNLLTALSTNNVDPTKASRPFDRLRDGFVLGEGSSVVILEELEHAKRRGAKIYGEVLGYGCTADAYRITDIHPEGRGAIGCMRASLVDAGVNADEVGYVNAHGTSTTVNDKVKTVALQSSVRRSSSTGAGLEHQEHDGPLDRRGMCVRNDRLPLGHARWRTATDDQSRKSRSAMRSRLHS